MTVALWIAGGLLYLFIGAFLAQIAYKDEELDASFLVFTLFWPVAIVIGLGVAAAKKVRQ